MTHAVCSADGLGCALVADIDTVGGLLRIEDRSIFNIALWQVPFHSTVGKDHNVPIRFSRTEPFGPVVDQSEEEVVESRAFLGSLNMAYVSLFGHCITT